MCEYKLNRDEISTLIGSVGMVIPSIKEESRQELLNILIKLKLQGKNIEDEEITKLTKRNITQFDSSTVGEFRKRLQDHLDEFTKEHGISLDIGKLTYSDKIVEGKFTSTVIEDASDPDSVLRTQYIADLNGFAHLGFKEEHFGKDVYGGKYELIGFEPKARKYKLKVRNKITKEIGKLTLNGADDLLKQQP